MPGPKHWSLRVVVWLSLLALTGVTLAAAAWFLSGGRVYSVQTGSMQPLIRPGDSVLVRPVSYAAIRRGQIVSFRDRRQPNLIITHRILSIDHRHGTLVTKGDHNPQPDLPISGNQLAGRAVMLAPGLGRFTNWLRRPIGLAIAVYLPAVLLVSSELRKLQSRHFVYNGR